jgi:hypothetical protein
MVDRWSSCRITAEAAYRFQDTQAVRAQGRVGDSTSSGSSERVEEWFGLLATVESERPREINPDQSRLT